MKATLLLLLGLFGASEAGFDVALRIRYPEPPPSNCWTGDTDTYIGQVIDSVYYLHRLFTKSSSTRHARGLQPDQVKYCAERCRGLQANSCFLAYPNCRPGWRERRNLRGEALTEPETKGETTAVENQEETTSIEPGTEQDRRLFMDFVGLDVPGNELNHLSRKCIEIKEEMDRTLLEDHKNHSSKGSCESMFARRPTVDCVVVYN